MAMPKNTPVDKDLIFNKGGIKGPPAKKSTDLRRMESRAPVEQPKAPPKKNSIGVYKNNVPDSATPNLTSNEVMTGILSYLGILVLIPLLAIKKEERNEYITFHIQQGINLFILEIIVWVACAIIFGVLTVITFGLFGIIGAIISWLISLVFLVVIVIAIVKSMQGEKWEIPVLGAAKFVKL